MYFTNNSFCRDLTVYQVIETNFILETTNGIEVHCLQMHVRLIHHELTSSLQLLFWWQLCSSKLVTIRWQEQITQQLSTKTHVAVNLIVLFLFKNNNNGCKICNYERTSNTWHYYFKFNIGCLTTLQSSFLSNKYVVYLLTKGKLKNQPSRKIIHIGQLRRPSPAPTLQRSRKTRALRCWLKCDLKQATTERNVSIWETVRLVQALQNPQIN
jgi:hypothetical protein